MQINQEKRSQQEVAPVFPLLSIVLPVSQSAASLLLWTLRSYSLQTADFACFEVVVVDDGGPHESVEKVVSQEWPFTLRYFVSPREREGLAHKNHARNVGWRWAYGEIVFICDCDCLVHPEFVERVLGLYQQAKGKGEPFVLYPMIASLRQGLGGDVRQWQEVLEGVYSSLPCGSHNFGGFFKKESLQGPARLELLKEHPEGFPILGRGLFEVIGEFDQAFFGWGGNKQEFQQRIIDAQVIRQYLLHGCGVFHQPHGKDGGNRKRSSNHGLMNRKREERKKCGQWQRRVALLKESPEGNGSEVLERWQREAIAVTHYTRSPQTQKIKRAILRNFAGLPDKERKILFVGPWTGEFGWEVCRWQGGIRKLVREKYQDYYIIVCGDTGHQVFYEYAHEFWALPDFVYQQQLTREIYRLLPEDKARLVYRCIHGLLATQLRKLPGKIEFLAPKRYLPREQTVVSLQASKAAICERDYLLKQRQIKKWVAIFPRQRQLNPQKNWPEENWQRLIAYIIKEWGYAVVLMGRPEDTSLLAREERQFITTAQVQAERRLDLNVAFLQDAVASIGSESGGPFLSLMCGSPTLVMGGAVHQQRYTREENFLATPCCFLAKRHYQHPYEQVQGQVEKFLMSLEQHKQTQGVLTISQKQEVPLRRDYQSQYETMKREFGFEYNKREKQLNNLLVFGQNRQEFEAVDRLLADYRSKHPFTSLVELGAHTGATTWMLSRHLQEQGIIIGVDNLTFPGKERAEAVYDKLRQEKFSCHYLTVSTDEALQQVQGLIKERGGIDLLHIDAAHEYHQVKKDWHHYVPLVKKGGIILLHDICYMPEITKFWEEIKIFCCYREVHHGGQGMAVIVKE